MSDSYSDGTYHGHDVVKKSKPPKRDGVKTGGRRKKPGNVGNDLVHVHTAGGGGAAHRPSARSPELRRMSVRRSALMSKILAGKKAGADVSALREKRHALNEKIYARRQALAKKKG